MSDAKSRSSQNKEMEALIKLVNNLRSCFAELDIGFEVDFPQIAVVGGQSSGKSSVLESFLGTDFLPRGTGIVTRRPLILELIHNENDEEYAEFQHIPEKRFNDYDDVRIEIQNETDRVTGRKQGISSKPIHLKIHSPHVLTLTLIDLPGITKNPVGDQPDNIYDIIKEMIMEFIENENCLILAVSAGNTDLGNSDAINLAKEVDSEGHRTIGVITMLDIMDDGTDASDILLGHLLPLKRGYVGVVQRSQKDINKRKTITDALKTERQFFLTHPAYKNIADRCGSAYLQKLLSEELGKHIRDSLPKFLETLQAKQWRINEELERLQVKENDPCQLAKLMLTLIHGLVEDFDMECGRSGSVNVEITTLSGGARIKQILTQKFPAEILVVSWKDEQLRGEIALAVENIHGFSVGIFTPDLAFETVVRKQIAKFLEPSLRCVEAVTTELDSILKKCLLKFSDYPALRMAIDSATRAYILDCQKETKLRLTYMIQVQSAYMNTLHTDFVRISKGQETMASYNEPGGLKATAALASNAIPNGNGPLQNGFGHEQNDVKKSGTEAGIVPPEMKEQVDIIQKLVESYISIMKETVTDYMPKIVAHAMIKSMKEFIFRELLTKIKDAGPEEVLLSRAPEIEARVKELQVSRDAIMDALAMIENSTTGSTINSN